MATSILDNIDTKHLGGLLKKARKKCGMTQADAGKVIDAARTTIVAIEKGDRRIRPGELIALARAYGQSVSHFVRPRPVVEPFQVQFRAAYKLTREEQTQIEPFILELEELCQNYIELEEIVKTALPLNYPSEYEVGNAPLKTVLAPIRYQHLAIEALDRGLITEGRFADFLKVDRLEARRIAQILRERRGVSMEEDIDFDLSRERVAGG